MGAFENGLCWTLYKHMEADFRRFLEYVPYTNENRNVYSPRLLAMLLQICGYIDTVFKEMAKYQSFRRKPNIRAINNLRANDYRGFSITLARNAFEEIYKLSTNNGTKLIAKLDWVGDKPLTPFADFGKNKSPSWWYDYNNVKHNWSANIKRANMDNVLEALSGAFLLNAIHYPSIELLWRLGVFKTIIPTGTGPSIHYLSKTTFQILLKKARRRRELFNYHFIVDTPLFECNNL